MRMDAHQTNKSFESRMRNPQSKASAHACNHRACQGLSQRAVRQMHHVSEPHLLHCGAHRGPHDKDPLPREARFFQVLVNTLMCFSDLIPSVLACKPCATTVHVKTCTLRGMQAMEHVLEPTHLCRCSRTHAHPCGNVLAGKPKRCPKAHPILPPPMHAHTLTHTQTHTRSLAHTGLLGFPGAARRRTPYFRRQCTRTHTYPRVLAKVKDADTFSPDGADLAPGATQGYFRWSKTLTRCHQLARTRDLEFLTLLGQLGAETQAVVRIMLFSCPG